MMRRYNRLLVAFYVLSDAALAMLALLIAYWLRFQSGLIEVTKGDPGFEQYRQMLPFIAVLSQPERIYWPRTIMEAASWKPMFREHCRAGSKPCNGMVWVQAKSSKRAC